MKKIFLLLFVFSVAFAGEENNKPTAIQMAPVELVVPVSKAEKLLSLSSEVKTVAKSAIKSEVKVSKRKGGPREGGPRSWHPRLRIGFTLIVLGIVLAVVGLGFVGGLSAFIGLLFTISGLLHTY
jgi:hypothetical protein